MWYGQKMKWLQADGDTVAWGVPPKNGSTALRRTMERDFGDGSVDSGWHLVNPVTTSQRIFVIRHPVDRFKSLWLNKCRDARLRSERGMIARVAGMSPEELFEHIQQHDNHHWTRQTELLGDMREGTEIIPLEGLSARYEQQYGKPYLVRNVSPNKEEVVLTEELLLRLEDFYYDDFELYGSVHERRPEED